MSFEIKGRKIGPQYPPYIIAELSANHNGNIERALKTIKSAHENGADAIKIQTYTADTMTIDCDRDEFMIRGGLWDGYKLYDLYKWAETPFEWHKVLFDYAANLGITIFSLDFKQEQFVVTSVVSFEYSKILGLRQNLFFPLNLKAIIFHGIPSFGPLIPSWTVLS